MDKSEFDLKLREWVSRNYVLLAEWGFIKRSAWNKTSDELYAALNTEEGQKPAQNSVMADIARAFDDGFIAGSMRTVPKDIAWREWQRRQ